MVNHGLQLLTKKLSVQVVMDGTLAPFLETYGPILWPHFYGARGATLELNLTRLVVELIFAHLSGEEDFFLLAEGKLD